MMLQHKLKGSNNYTVVGSPTIVNGVASGFSGSDYLKITPNLPDINDNDIEVLINAKKLGISGNGYRTIFRCDSFTISLANASALLMTIRTKKSGESSYTTRTTYNWGFVINNDNAKWLKLTKNGNVFSIEGSNDGISYTSGHSYTLEEYEEIQNPATNIFFDQANWGTIGTELFLNSTYIKVNGQPWFGVCPIEVKKHQIMGPVGYTKVGSPTITDGILNLPTSSDYIRTNASTVNWNDVDFEFFTKATPGKYPPAGGSILISFGQGDGNNLNFIDNRLWVGNRGDITPQEGYTLNFTEQNFVLGTYYYIRFKKVGSIVSLAWSVDKVNWTEQTSNIGSSTNTFVSTGNIQYGKNAYMENEQYSGSIDLNETYIKVNDKLWYWQPQETKKIVVNGVEVWEKTQ